MLSGRRQVRFVHDRASRWPLFHLGRTGSAHTRHGFAEEDKWAVGAIHSLAEAAAFLRHFSRPGACEWVAKVERPICEAAARDFAGSRSVAATSSDSDDPMHPSADAGGDGSKLSSVAGLHIWYSDSMLEQAVMSVGKVVAPQLGSGIPVPSGGPDDTAGLLGGFADGPGAATSAQGCLGGDGDTAAEEA